MDLRAAFVVACLCTLPAREAGAATRGLRIDFGTDWGDAFAIGSASCPGSSGLLIQWNGFTFSGYNAGSFADTYCQSTAPDEFSSASFFQGDENGLATLVGPNTDNAASAIRYTYVDPDRFDANKAGFQWAFYAFPAKNITIVELYLEGLGSLVDATSYIKKGTTPFWLGGTDGYAGEYFCFTGSGAGTTFAGTWDGTLEDSRSACLAPFVSDFVIHRDGFE